MTSARRRNVPGKRRSGSSRRRSANGKTLEIVYLKAKDEKSRRSIKPLSMGEMEYNGRPFTGLEAFCLTRREKRVFQRGQDPGDNGGVAAFPDVTNVNNPL